MTGVQPASAGTSAAGGIGAINDTPAPARAANVCPAHSVNALKFISYRFARKAFSPEKRHGEPLE